MKREELCGFFSNIDGGKQMRPSKENRILKYKKVSEFGESGTLSRNAANVEPDILDYVRKQMHRATATCEVIGAAILFQEEMHREMSIIEEQLMNKAGFEEEEGFGVRW